MEIICYLIIMLVMTICDISDRTIPNFIILPAIVIGLYMTNNFIFAGIMFILGISLFGYEWKCPHCNFIEKNSNPLAFWRGGDVKMMILAGAFLGKLSIVVFLLCVLSSFLASKIKRSGVPVAPYLLASSIIAITTNLFLNSLGISPLR